MTDRLLVLGTTAYTEVFIDMFESVPGIVFEGCVENLERARCELTLAGLPVYWNDDVDRFRQSHHLICSLGTTERIGWIKEMVARGFSFATLVHPRSLVSKRTELGRGVSIDAGTVVAGFSRIGGWVRIGRRVSFGHHTEIGDFSTVHPGAVISGNCKIGRRVTVGTGAVVIDGKTIGDGAFIAAGAIVNKNVPDGALVAGNPAVVKQTDYGPV